MLFDIANYSIAEAQMKDCIIYNESEKLIIVTCLYASFSDISNNVEDPSILRLESSDQGKKIWFLNAGILVDKGATLDINSNDVDWIKIIPSKDIPNAISV